MRIAPKLADHNTYIPAIIHDMYEGAVEFQLTGLDFKKSLDSCLTLVEQLPATDTAIFHLPFGVHDFITYLSSLDWQARLIDMMHELRWIDIKDVYLLMHLHTEMDTLQYLSPEDPLRKLIYHGGGKIKILLENGALPVSSKNLSTPPMAEFLSTYDIPGVFGCVDVTHLRMFSVYNQTAPEYDKQAAEKVKSFHIASLLKGDGWRDKATHGRVHASYEDLVQDMQFLAHTGLSTNNAILVTEVAEDDYDERPEQIREIEYLKRYRDDCSSIS